MNTILLAISFIISTAVSILILKQSNKKWLSMSCALSINALILTSAWFVYQASDESKLFGIDPYNRYVLILFIPILSWINFLMISFIKNKKIK